MTKTKPSNKPTVHNFVGHRVWGHDYAVLNVIDDGLKLQVSVHSPDPIRPGDYLILPNGLGTTRYQVSKVTWHPADPGDQYFATVVFAPRGS